MAKKPASANMKARALRAEGKSDESARRIANAQRKPGQQSVQAIRRNNDKPAAVKAARKRDGN
jgi:hypothetical protein